MAFDKKEKGSPPDFKGDGVAIWKNKKKDGEEYLSVKILGSFNVACWKFEPKEKSE